MALSHLTQNGSKCLRLLTAVVKITQGRQPANVNAVTINSVMTLSLSYNTPMLSSKMTAEHLRQCIAVLREMIGKQL